jgi:hypothetical protein
MTTVTYTHTCIIGSMNMLVATILLLHQELIKLTGDVDYSAGVHIPVGIDTIRRGHHVCHLLVAGEVPVKTLPAVLHNVAKLATELALISWPGVATSSVPATIITGTMDVSPTSSSKTTAATAMSCDVRRHELRWILSIKASLDTQHLSI